MGHDSFKHFCSSTLKVEASADGSNLTLPTVQLVRKKKHIYVWQCFACGCASIRHTMRNCICTRTQLGRNSRRHGYIYKRVISRNSLRDSRQAVGRQRAIFDWDIDMLSPTPTRQLKRTVALLDTQCQNGNVISSKMLKRLGVTETDISIFKGDGMSWSIANGQSLIATGLITLDFKRENGTKYYECDFYVVSEPVNYDVILGAEFIAKHEVLTMREDACLPLVQVEEPSTSELQQIAIAKEEQRKKKAEREARQAAQQSQTQQGQSSTGYRS